MISIEGIKIYKVRRWEFVRGFKWNFFFVYIYLMIEIIKCCEFKGFFILIIFVWWMILINFNIR